jgi:transcriptional regulator with XRE-family HTH domain
MSRGSKANFEKIRELSNVKKITLKQLCERIGISQNGLQQIIKKNSTKTEILEAISAVFDVPIGYFFDDNLSERLKDLESKVARYSNENYILFNLVSELRFRISHNDLKLANCIDNYKYFLDKYPNDPRSIFLKEFGEVSFASEFDTEKFISTVKSELSFMKDAEDEFLRHIDENTKTSSKPEDTNTE